jgi:hypothetical protein
VLLFFSVARSQENGSWERAAEVAPVAANFGMNMPMMSSAFDTSMWLNAA